MTRLPRLKGKEVVRILQRIGFQVIRTRGSHVFLGHEDGRVTTVPVHSGETIGPGLLPLHSSRC
jgi:predicted RNA binding protein YcfA (HicA-like mRNA interferase family)